MSAIFNTGDGLDRLVVGGRHTKPVTDELLVSVHNAYQRRSVVLSRQTVADLHAALGRWLADGRPGVTKKSCDDTVAPDLMAALRASFEREDLR